MAKRYETTARSAMHWAAAELEHVGRIAATADPDIQYAYAMSTLNGMAHLKDALFELVTDPAYEMQRTDLQRTHDAVVRTMKHLKAEYQLDLDAIRQFNTRGTLSDLSYLVEEMGMGEEPVGMMVEEMGMGEEPVGRMASEEYPSNNVVSQNGGKRRRLTKRRLSHQRKTQRKIQRKTQRF